MKWVAFDAEGALPAERRNVLLQCGPHDLPRMGLPPSVVVGYLRYAAGDLLSPHFVTPGAIVGNVTHWCDCLGDAFVAPLWKVTNGTGMQRGYPATTYADRVELIKRREREAQEAKRQWAPGST
jgi:hypothetical protein